jgi:dipeptidyl aminopeptidase/acylaminoacyl peptidase
MNSNGTFRLALKAIAAISVALILAAVLRIVIFHYRDASEDFAPWPGTPILQHPETVGVAGLNNVSFVAKTGNKVLAWYVPSRNRAAIVISHGTNADRSALLPELRFLANAGFGVLAIDWPGDGGSEGEIHWGENERQTLTAAIDWLMARDDVDNSKIGVFGFSMGGYITAQVASSDTRISAVALAAAPTDFVEYTRWDNRRWGWLSQYSALLAVRAAKMPTAELLPVEVIQHVAPRPLLIIGGDADATIPEFMTRKLFAAAKEPKQLWIVHGAGHGNYVEVAPQEYQNQLVGFFLKSLTPSTL